MKRFNYYTLLLPVIIVVILYWIAFDRANYPVKPVVNQSIAVNK